MDMQLHYDCCNWLRFVHILTFAVGSVITRCFKRAPKADDHTCRNKRAYLLTVKEQGCCSQETLCGLWQRDSEFLSSRHVENILSWLPDRNQPVLTFDGMDRCPASPGKFHASRDFLELASST